MQDERVNMSIILKEKAKLIIKLALIISVLIWVSWFCPSLKASQLTYYRYYIVEKGDNLWEISKQYDVSIENIKKKNNLGTDIIRPNQKLVIPVKVEGIYHAVKKYETLWRICKIYGVAMDEVISLNRLPNPNQLALGQKLFIPGASKVKQIDIPEKIIIPEKKDIPIPKQEKEITESSISQKKVQEKEFLIWPVEGKIKAYRESGFGIDILALEGASIVATAKGKVWYSDWVRNYGWTIIIEHQELKLYTCYMHNSINLVEKDDLVEQGEDIARIGNSGTAEETMLHFEIRGTKDGKSINPFEYIPSLPVLNNSND